VFVLSWYVISGDALYKTEIQPCYMYRLDNFSTKLPNNHTICGSKTLRKLFLVAIPSLLKMLLYLNDLALIQSQSFLYK